MNIATELLSHIKARSLDSFYAVEESLIDGRSMPKEDRATLSQLLGSGGSADDRLRLLLLLLLHPQSHVSEAELAKAEQALKDDGADTRPLLWLRRLREVSQLQSTAVSQRADGTGGGGGGYFSRAMQLADQVGVGSNARWVTSALAAGVKQLLPSRR